MARDALVMPWEVPSSAHVAATAALSAYACSSDLVTYIRPASTARPSRPMTPTRATAVESRTKPCLDCGRQFLLWRGISGIARMAPSAESAESRRNFRLFAFEAKFPGADCRYVLVELPQNQNRFQ